MARQPLDDALTSRLIDTEFDAAQEKPARRYLRQLALQGAAAFAVFAFSGPYFALRNAAQPWPEIAIAVGCTALLFATITKQAWWWRLIHSVFAPLAWAISLLALDANWFLLAFVAMLLVYRGAVTEQIPLFFSNKQTAAAVSLLTANYASMRFIDLGSGFGNIVRSLAFSRPDAQLEGVENAPAIWLIGRFLTLKKSNCAWRFGDFWSINLKEYDVVYAFLSPAPMPELWQKVVLEMQPGSLFISNSFAVPGIPPDRTVTVDDARKTQLYCYQR